MDAAVLTSIAAIIVTAVSAWWNARRLRRHESELTELRSRLARGSELELKLFVLACESVTDASRALARAQEACINSRFLEHAALVKVDADLDTVGHFLPPELQDPFDWARNGIRNWVRELTTPPEDLPFDDPDERSAVAKRSCQRFVRAAAKWKGKLWTAFAPNMPAPELPEAIDWDNVREPETDEE